MANCNIEDNLLQETIGLQASVGACAPPFPIQAVPVTYHFLHRMASSTDVA
jgi:hypothetical protein